MSLNAVASLGLGIAWRVFINAAFGYTDEKTAGGLLGLWDGIASQRTWRSGHSPEPLMLAESIGGLLFDVFYHASLIRTASLVLGAFVGVLLADVFPALWEDLGEPAAKALNNLKFVDDLNSSVVLSEGSDGVTLIYEEYSTKYTTRAWIAEQRKHKLDTTGTSRRRSTPATRESTTRKSKALTQSSGRAESVKEDEKETASPVPVAAPLPLPPPSAFSTININIQPPSAASIMSSVPPTTIPTIRTDFIEGLDKLSSRHSGGARSVANNRSNASGSTVKERKTTVRDIGEAEILVSPQTPVNAEARYRAFSRSHSRGRSMPSIRAEEQPIRIEVARSFVESESTTSRIAESIGHTLSATPRRSMASRIPSRSPSPPPKSEVVIDYTQDATKIVIPPGGVHGDFSVRVVKHEDEWVEDARSEARSKGGITNGPSDLEPVPPIPQSLRHRPASVRATPIAHVMNLAPSVTAPRSQAGRGRSVSSRYSQVDVNGLLLDVNEPQKPRSTSAKGARSVRSRSHSVKRTQAAKETPLSAPQMDDGIKQDTPRLSPARLRAAAMQGASIILSPTMDDSVVSLGHDEDFYQRAERLRQQAKEVETSLKAMREHRQEAMLAGHPAQAYALQFEIKDAELLAQKLHRKADRSLHLANNHIPIRVARIDVQGVQVLEAVKRVEKALRTVQQGGGKELQVVLSQGGLESASSTVVKSAIVDKMSKKYHLQVTKDKEDPGLLHIYLS